MGFGLFSSRRTSTHSYSFTFTMKPSSRYALIGLMLLLPVVAQAAYSPAPTPLPTNNVLDDFVAKYIAKAQLWEASLLTHANSLFWILAVIEFAWMSLTLALRTADIQEFVIAVIKRLMTIGLFYWFLLNGSGFAKAIIDSLYTAANDATAASGGPTGISPSGLFDLAGNAFLDVTRNISAWNVVEGICSVICGIILVVSLAMTCAFLVIALIETYICVYAGVILLGFGGAKWTRDYSLAYLKYALAAGMKLFMTQLIIAIGGAIIADWLSLPSNVSTYQGLILLAAVSIVLAMMVARIPGMASGLMTGASIGGGDELAAPARMAATGVAAAAGVGAAVRAMKTQAASAIGVVKAMRAAQSSAVASISSTAGQSFGARVGAGVANITGSSSAGNSATKLATSFGRGAAVAKGTVSTLAKAYKQDYAARNDGSISDRGSLGARMASSIGGAARPSSNNSNPSSTPSPVAATTN